MPKNLIIRPFKCRPTILEEPLITEEEHDQIGDFEDDEFHLPAIENQQILNQSHHFLRMDIICKYCKALHLIEDKLVRSSRSNPKFGTCCSEGQIRLHALRDPPTLFKTLYVGSDNQSKSFLRHTFDYIMLQIPLQVLDV